MKKRNIYKWINQSFGMSRYSLDFLLYWLSKPKSLNIISSNEGDLKYLDFLDESIYDNIENDELVQSIGLENFRKVLHGISTFYIDRSEEISQDSNLELVSLESTSSGRYIAEICTGEENKQILFDLGLIDTGTSNAVFQLTFFDSLSKFYKNKHNKKIGPIHFKAYQKPSIKAAIEHRTSLAVHNLIDKQHPFKRLFRGNIHPSEMCILLPQEEGRFGTKELKSFSGFNFFKSYDLDKNPYAGVINFVPSKFIEKTFAIVHNQGLESFDLVDREGKKLFFDNQGFILPTRDYVSTFQKTMGDWFHEGSGFVDKYLSAIEEVMPKYGEVLNIGRIQYDDILYLSDALSLEYMKAAPSDFEEAYRAPPFEQIFTLYEDLQYWASVLEDYALDGHDFPETGMILSENRSQVNSIIRATVDDHYLKYVEIDNFWFGYDILAVGLHLQVASMFREYAIIPTEGKDAPIHVYEAKMMHHIAAAHEALERLTQSEYYQSSGDHTLSEGLKSMFETEFIHPGDCGIVDWMIYPEIVTFAL